MFLFLFFGGIMAGMLGGLLGIGGGILLCRICIGRHPEKGYSEVEVIYTFGRRDQLDIDAFERQRPWG